ncbi:Protein of uncharacterised function (DUF2628) [Mycobacteroides abscessus subsp. bolletii]|uniref:Protein of uncharacterized function (DUF2628) n=3 Tax=Mycobacteroides abscessus TaxID=36809 RepID=A0A9Q7SEN7_9MYCO|nr:Protein of uncharacterised function (DUF2628) [Mycobacteroides abscessus subsp. bolletii]SHP40309.1 Protein of uncharacterised function (DUF2628) [Mycobacteroides abscessus subsp. abscessus]SKU20969.1 Protein of uncharacterised function (DUF2628) [Mycobacteroides abscessus subsp. massiliense]SHP39953.1 Protein of uncharacterised function (DUF2628) [Mycobacteroides abscessus subsp. bolletii]SHR21166.1 Protein of uncharacterised function (DUF2628) [Mycobacteroides abscessus subsp. bolletii]
MPCTISSAWLSASIASTWKFARLLTVTDDRSDLSAYWRLKFDFYDRYGTRFTPEAVAAAKARPFAVRMRSFINLPALFFGPIYFVAKGMWRKAITVMLFGLFLGVVVYLAVPGLGFGGFSTNGAVYMILAGPAYYRHRVVGSRSWNPFDGIGWRFNREMREDWALRRR